MKGRFTLNTVPALVLAYFAYFGVLGIFIPYLGLFLDGRGLSSYDIGVLLAIVTATRIVGPSIWAALADRQGKPTQVMQWGAVLATIGWFSSFFDQGFLLLVVGLSLFSFFWTAILPQLEVTTFHFLNDNTERYSRIRSSGSLGYIVLVMVGGLLLQQFGTESLPYGAAILMGLLILSLFLLPAAEVRAEPVEQVPGYWSLLRKPVFVCFMGAAFILQMSFAPFYAFFTLYARDLGYSGIDTGLLISLAVLAEIVAFFWMGWLLKNRSYRLVLSCCYALTMVRWLMLAYLAHSPLWLMISMLMHAASFAIAHSCAMQFIQHYFPRKQRSKGQAFYAGLIFGGGGAVGAYGAGILWQDGAGASQTFLIAAAMAGFATLLALCLPAQVHRLRSE
ncbi:MFS transporter [Alkalimonas collagenimarina]|uniref:MFS transporter n=1 Tax=Alkalimonas collagenimarina TaxID=400390 RepID=A0ABT9GZW9_9GAMM|nr:MFS transporter [Alkalimonas collagenimarina]MDP4536424.1 MFS transporter [Alkalimonas collagenimarina]